MPPPTPDIIVVGAGHAGRAAALELQARGCAVHLVEAAPEATTPDAASVAAPLLDPLAWPPLDEGEAHALQQWRIYASQMLASAEAEGLTSRTQPLQDVSYISWLASCLLPRRVAEHLVAVMERTSGAAADQASALFGLACAREALTDSPAVALPAERKDVPEPPLPPALPVTLGGRVLRVERTLDENRRTACTVEMLTQEGLCRMPAAFVILALSPRALRGVELVPSLSPRQWAAIFSLQDGPQGTVWPVGRSPFDDLAAALREESQGLLLAGAWVHGGRPDAAVFSGRAAAARVAARLATPGVGVPDAKGRPSPAGREEDTAPEEKIGDLTT